MVMLVAIIVNLGINLIVNEKTHWFLEDCLCLFWKAGFIRLTGCFTYVGVMMGVGILAGITNW
jgi:hypothetical protein